jgi:hypothetical protein
MAKKKFNHASSDPGARVGLRGLALQAVHCSRAWSSSDVHIEALNVWTRLLLGRRLFSLLVRAKLWGLGLAARSHYNEKLLSTLSRISARKCGVTGGARADR